MKNNYNLIAKFYDGLAHLMFGKAIKNAQKQWLSFIPPSANILFVGGGSGKVLKELLALKPNCKVIYVDASKKMIQLSKQTINSEQYNIRYLTEKVEDLELQKTEFDVIITFFFLDLFQEEKVTSIFNHLNYSLKVEGLWLYADFVEAQTFLMKLLYRLMIIFLKLSTNIESNQIFSHAELFCKSYEKTEEKRFFHNHIISTVYKKVNPY